MKIKDGNIYPSEKEWNAMLKMIEENGGFIEKELAKIANARDKRIKEEDAEDEPYRRKIVK